MAELLIEQLQSLGALSEEASLEATEANEESPPHLNLEKYSEILKICQSKLLILKAQRKYCKLVATKGAESVELDPHKEIVDLNEAVTQAKLHEAAYERAKESFVFPMNSDRDYIQTELADTYLEHNTLVETLNRLINERNKKLRRAYEKKAEVKQEIMNFKKMLSVQKQKLASKEEEETTEKARKETLILKKLDRLNLSRTLVGNILATSGINFIKQPKWAEILVKCRKPVTIDNLTSYKLQN